MSKKNVKEVEKEIEKILEKNVETEEAAPVPEASVSVEAQVAQTTTLSGATVKHCVFCDVKRTDFVQPGKDLRGKWICPDCVLLV